MQIFDYRLSIDISQRYFEARKHREVQLLQSQVKTNSEMFLITKSSEFISF